MEKSNVHSLKWISKISLSELCNLVEGLKHFRETEDTYTAFAQFLFGEKYTWETNQNGPVGNFETAELKTVFDAIKLNPAFIIVHEIFLEELKDKAGREVDRVTDEEYQEKYGEHLQRGTKKYGKENLQRRLYVKK